MLIFYEAQDISERQIRKLIKHNRRQRAKGMGWTNWYINRGLLPLSPTKADLRRVSWRRKH